ncbi:MAG: macro domain-containing protein [bacterium]
MKITVNSSTLELVQGDITQQDTAAIGNAANAALAGGGGVDGAIHRAGGREIMQELKAKYTGCPTGNAVISGGGNLKARYIIHAVGPRYTGKPKDKELLRNAYVSSLRLCTAHNISSIAFPSISTGIYGYPIKQASEIALKAVINYLKDHPDIRHIKFVLFNTDAFEQYTKTLKEITL